MGNGYTDTVEEYIGKEIEKFKEDSDVFSVCVKYLNTYMNRCDWPYCYQEFKNKADEILGSDIEYVARVFEQFLNREKHDPNAVNGWDKNLPKGFREECTFFSNIIMHTRNQYYDLTNNPLGIDRVINIDNQGYKKLIRIRRIDGEVFDLYLSKLDIEDLSKALLNIAKEG